MAVYGFPDNFVTFHDNKDYYCFLRKDDTIKELINEFPIVILGSKFSSSEDYDVKIIFCGKNQAQDLRIKNIFQIKNDNNVMFTVSKRKLSGTMSKRKLSDFQCKSIFPKQSASKCNDIVQISDNKHYCVTNKNPEKSFWNTDDVVMPKDNNLNIPISNDVNSTIAKDVDVPTKSNIDIPTTDDVVMPKDNNLNIPISNDVNSTIAKNAVVPAKSNINIPNKNKNIIITKTNIPTINQSGLYIN